MIGVAVLDDWQGVAASCADWSVLRDRARVQFFTEPFADADALVAALADFEIIVPMRERTKFTRPLLQRLLRLRLLALTGMGVRHVDVDYCNERGILCCGSGTYTPAGMAEFTLGLIIAALRHIPLADAAMHAGGYQRGIPLGTRLEGKTLGLIGLGNIGSRVASYGRAIGMHVIAWSPHLSAEKAHRAGAEAVDKQTLLARADVVCLHLVLSERTRGILGATDLAAMKPGALLVNTARGPLVDEAALLEALRRGQISAALDVYDEEPLPTDHPLRRLPNVVLTPHLGFCTTGEMGEFYQQSVENIRAFLDGAPARVLNAPAARGKSASSS
jgi:phosphoglycerate dehydrogenase-like enzyme